jgi:MFS family permease
MWSAVVVLPAVQAEFGVDRAWASFPYTLTMTGFGIGGILMGRLSDRCGVVVPLTIGTVCLGAGYVAAAFAPGILVFAIVQGAVIAMLGSAASFGPLIADISHWFTRNRGIAVAICASGSYLGGAVWPPVIQHFVEQAGWRQTYIGIGVFCVVTMLPLGFMFRRRHPGDAGAPSAANPADAGGRRLAISPRALQVLLIVAGFACCVAMSMPQVHIVALCSDRGFGAARGAEMLSLMLGFGIVSRLASGWISDRIGGVRTLLLGSSLQGVALVCYLFADGLTSLYLISAMFGLFQGGIIPSYAMIIREYFPAKEAGARVGMVLMASLGGMAFGGWVTGAIFDLAGSYRAAFMNGIGWNLLNMSIAYWLLRQGRPRIAPASA